MASIVEQHDNGSAICMPLFFAAIGISSILYPHSILEGEAYDKLREKQAFANALGVIFIGFAIGSHAPTKARGFARISFWGRLVGGRAAVFSFAYILKSIVAVDGCPWG